MGENIVIKGAREHNLKNIDITLPRDKFIVITGLSGSGKSSLAFDTIYAEGHRRYVESLSSYARQFLGQMEKPDVDSIEGLSPSISIDQKTTNRNPHSTVGTVTEIYDYLRLLYARVGVPHCPVCGKEIKQQTVDQIIDKVMELSEGTKFMVMAPIIREKKGEHQKVFKDALKSGYARVRVDGIIYDLTEEIKLEKNNKHSIEIIVDRLVMKEDMRQRLADSVETALSIANGLVIISVVDGEDMIFSQNYACADHGISVEELSPRMFSFNNPFGACKSCSGLGVVKKIDIDKIVPNKDLTIREGAIRASGWYYMDEGSFAYSYLTALADKYKFSLDVPVNKLSKKALDIIFYGSKGEKLDITLKTDSRSTKISSEFEGIINNLERRYLETKSEFMRHELDSYMSDSPCKDCGGERLNPIARNVTVADKSITEVTRMSISKCLDFFKNISLSEKDMKIARLILKEIVERLSFLKNVGLEYLTLSREARSLSGGESQRIRLATQIGSHLMGVLYILDEPSIGLHQRDNQKLLDALKSLRDLGNTLIVVEHDEDTMHQCDYIVDIGPGAGVHGGEVVFTGTYDEILKSEKSITGEYLSGRKRIEVPKKRREGNGKFIEVIGAKENNLKNINVKIPLGTFTCVTGVSGSGKSSLVNRIIYKKLAKDIMGSNLVPGEHKNIKGIGNIDKIINIDQSPIGRTPRSNPATYTGAFNDIRELFASTQTAKMRGYTASRFSFNVKGGRCEACQGDGNVKIEMHFLPDIYVQCDVCKGKKYNRETLEVKYKGKNIYDVLDMTVDEAAEFFENIPKLKRKLDTLKKVGLSYIKLGQASTTLSGGEAQRIKLATELSKVATSNTMYILDEPTTGLHSDDVKKLIKVLHTFVENGNTVMVIEHNLDVIKTADYIVDLGPEGGDKGGEIVAAGSPEEIVKCEKSHTGKFLKKYIE